jgi:hypothetical protein
MINKINLYRSDYGINQIARATKYISSYVKIEVDHSIYIYLITLNYLNYQIL